MLLKQNMLIPLSLVFSLQMLEKHDIGGNQLLLRTMVSYLKSNFLVSLGNKYLFVWC